MSEKYGRYVCQFIMNGRVFFICSDCRSSPHPSAETSLIQFHVTDVAGFIDVEEERFVVISRGRQNELEKPTITKRLTQRELQIMAMIAEGKVNKQIADFLNISQWTVSTHLRRIYAKLGVDRRGAMIYNCAQTIKHYQEHTDFGEENPKRSQSKTGRSAV
jgi:DNA-binding CsgD family transcriptional regulator